MPEKVVPLSRGVGSAGPAARHYNMVFCKDGLPLDSGEGKYYG
ncbi:hypothetical protein AFE_0931 [Acidithiobacillus ferrooxidans ATCC 23270]|uniref:Uncharacterized protein n=1 Tax=Acidithiobacillus ferrooxidans (strain ATCC 23270 / DSM 14882 / CIP 104768 / NCIMB 8455) TaxID=243159 RepID=B7J7A8_ACIF2|nr:hypothetical protein AFE_0931 [Acidithiobacillus ferrooxidans ATCC 23270]